MTSRLVRVQLVLFVVVTVLGVFYAGINYVRIPRIFGIGRYDVKIQLASAGGLYPQAAVTVRGVGVGQVKSVDLTANGVEATLQIDDGTHIPTNSIAEVRNTSAIGEQYVDFEPPAGSSTGPYMNAGYVVPVASVHLPPAVDTVLTDANALLASVPTDALRTTIDELYTGLQGNGGNLRQIVDATDLLVHAGLQNVGPTTQLIDNAQQVLATQQASLPDLYSYVPDVRDVSQTLDTSSPEITGTFSSATPFATELHATFAQLTPVLPQLLGNLNAVGQVVDVYLPNVESVLTVLPATNNEVQGDIEGSPAIAAGASGRPEQVAALNFKAPGTLVNDQYCTIGYPSANNQRSPTDLSLTKVDVDAYCGANGTSPPADQILRGARNGECPNTSAVRSATAAGCGLIFDPNYRSELDGTPFSLGTGSVAAGTAASAAATSTVTTYDPLTGLTQLPDGTNVILGGVVAGDRMTSWRSLFLDPLGVPST